MTVTIGIDPHKRTHTAVAIDDRGHTLDELRIDASRAQVDTMLAWAQRFPDRRWAIEGAGGLGRQLALGLVSADEHVVDVPSILSARIRTLNGTPHKTDAHDARSVALAGRHRPDLKQVRRDEAIEEIGLLLTRRDQLVAMRKRLLCWMHDQLVLVVPGGAKRKLTAPKVAKLLRKIPKNSGDAITNRRRELVVTLLGELRQVDRKISRINKELEAAVDAHGTTLRTITGIGTVGAATLLSVVGDPTRFPSEAKFASFAGVSPLEASSGNTRRHRVDLGGNRRVKGVLHTAAIAQISRRTEGRAYYERKLAQGFTRREALRCLKRQIASRVWRTMSRDATEGVGPGRTIGNG